MKFHDSSAGGMIKSALIGSIPGVIHGFGLRGVEIAAYLDALGVSDRSVTATNQIHGKAVHILPRSSGGILEGDAFISGESGTVCFVRTADCVPILIADTAHRAVAAVHAGWRGTAADIVGETIRAMNVAFGTNAKDCVAAIGPCICGKCYEVGSEVIDAMGELNIGDGWRIDDRHIDLAVANEHLLARAGLKRKNIERAPHCTRCDARLASWRRDKNPNERQFNFIVVN